jgi:hypothetical protein
MEKEIGKAFLMPFMKLLKLLNGYEKKNLKCTPPAR